MVILHKLFFSCGEVTFDDVCSMDVEAQNLTQCWMNNKDHVQHAQDIHKLPLHIAIDSQSNCLKLYFIEWQEQSI